MAATLPRSARRARGDRAHRVRAAARAGTSSSAQEPWRPLGSKAAGGPGPRVDDPGLRPRAGREEARVRRPRARRAVARRRSRTCPAWVHPELRRRATTASRCRRGVRQARASARSSSTSRAHLAPLERVGGRPLRQAEAGRCSRSCPRFDDEPRARCVEQVASDPLEHERSSLVEDDARPAFRKFVARAAREAKEGPRLARRRRTRPPAAATTRSCARSVLVAMGDLAEDEATLREADELAAKWLADPASVDADTGGRRARPRVAQRGRRRGSPRSSRRAQRQERARTGSSRCEAMVGFDDPGRLERRSTPRSDEIRRHEMRYVLSAAFARRTSRPIAEAWVRAHWDDLRKKLPGSLGSALVGAAGVGCTKAEAEERAAFYGRAPRHRGLRAWARRSARGGRALRRAAREGHAALLAKALIARRS